MPIPSTGDHRWYELAGSSVQLLVVISVALGSSGLHRFAVLHDVCSGPVGLACTEFYQLRQRGLLDHAQSQAPCPPPPLSLSQLTY